MRITNIVVKGQEAAVPKVLSIKASKLPQYINSLIDESNKKYTPNRSKKFDHLPLLVLWDLADTGEEFVYQTEKDLPKSTVFNSKGIPVLIIIPEKGADDIGLNKFRHLKKADRDKVATHLNSLPSKAQKLVSKS